MRQRGFSLTETLLAVGTLAIGLTFVAGTFLTGIYFSSVSTERTIAAVVAEEAFAKMQMFGIDPNNTLSSGPVQFVPYEQLAIIPDVNPEQQFRYPSALTLDAGERQFWWSALCSRVFGPVFGSDLVQCTVFVCRQAGASSTYWVRQSGPLWPQLALSNRPRPLLIQVVYDTTVTRPHELLIRDAVPGDGVDELAFVCEGAFLVFDGGYVCRVRERYADRPDVVRLADWFRADANDPSPWSGWAWIVPPAVSGGRNPVVGVYQRTLDLPRKALRPPGN